VKYNIIYADPPWRTKSFKERKDGFLSRNLPYPQMADDNIKKLKVSEIAAENCMLFLWCIDSRVPIVCEIMESWGFSFKCVGFVWAKKAKTTSGFNGGFSSYTKRDCEFCFIGARGGYFNNSRGVNQIILEPKRAHSQKPDIIRKRIVELCGDLPRVELFARERAEGWHTWGNEIESDIEL